MRWPDLRYGAISTALVVLASASHALPRCPDEPAGNVIGSASSTSSVAEAVAAAMPAAGVTPIDRAIDAGRWKSLSKIGLGNGSLGLLTPQRDVPLTMDSPAGAREPSFRGVVPYVQLGIGGVNQPAPTSPAVSIEESARRMAKFRATFQNEPWFTLRGTGANEDWLQARRPRTSEDPIWVQTPKGLQQKPRNTGCTNCQTGGGTSVPEGGLGGAPPGELVAGDRLPDGRPCWRLARNVDWRVDASSNTTNLMYDPSGFREVGVLAFRSAGVEIVRHCTFVRVSPTYIVTAAHCVAASDRREGKVLVSEPLMKGLLALIPSDATEKGNAPPARDVLRCWTQANDCGYHVGYPQGEALFHPGAAWADAQGIGTSFPVPDVAVLKVAFTAGTPSHFARIPSNPSVPTLITTLGYGLTDRLKMADDGNPIVGWSKHDGAQSLDGGLVYIAPTRGRRTKSCFGDSGGAVYGEGQNGSSREVPRELIAIVSGAQGMAHGIPAVDQCLNAPVGRAQTLAPIRDWLCKATRQEALGCS